jgi:DNA-binding transcriptional ArsR family regulator
MYNQMVVSNLSDTEMDGIFHALSDATRRDILARVTRTEQSVSGLAERYAMSFAAVQKHVAVLERAALVHKERKGRSQLVHAELGTVRKAALLLESYEEVWRHRASGIAALLGDDDSTTQPEGTAP